MSPIWRTKTTLPPEASNPIVIGSENNNLPETEDKDVKTAFMNIFKDLKENMNKYFL